MMQGVEMSLLRQELLTQMMSNLEKWSTTREYLLVKRYENVESGGSIIVTNYLVFRSPSHRTQAVAIPTADTPLS